MRAAAALIATLALPVSAHAYDEARATANLAADLLACSVFYTFAAELLTDDAGTSPSQQQQDTIATMRRSSEAALGLALPYWTASGRTLEAAKASSQLQTDDMLRKLGGNRGNITVVAVEYAYCRDAIESPDQRLAYWLAK